jgi:uncharacterized hydrophobic protein (TIGR00271 family)
MTRRMPSMSSNSAPGSGAAARNVTPTGKLGFRGRRATPEERALILDEFFFEGERRQPYLVQFFILMALSAAIASFGLANDSAAVVIGAMLVAPLMTPILASAAALVQGWLERAIMSLAIVAAGSLVAVGIGLIVALLTGRLASGAPLPGELLARTSPNMGDLAIAVLAGIAGAFVSVRSEASSALPGVGIAVALVPPRATIGMTLGVGSPDLAVGASLLYMTNLVGIVVAASVVFTLAGFAAFAATSERARRRAWAMAVIALMVVGVPLFLQSQSLLEENRTLASAAQVIDEWAPDHRLEDISIDRQDGTTRILLRIVGTEPPPATDELATMLAAALQRDVTTGVAYVALDEASAPAAAR